MTTGPFTVILDSRCPLWKREARWMRALDRGRGRLVLLDLSAPGFDPAPLGLTIERVTGIIHGLEPDGTILIGLDVFRRAYGSVGWGWPIAWTRWPLIRPIADAAYRVFSRNRYRLTGRTAPFAPRRPAEPVADR
jgi:predicted DCC family thiol-disulfide oxidoreductase YuxK